MKTYCWVCNAQVEVKFMRKVKKKDSLIVGNCKNCGSQIYKSLKGGRIRNLRR
ncbi:MAG: hypothetical protein WC979_05360 [Candidatus Pacearchaeota archaeon]|jgi:transcription elongation factor Elf1